MSPEKPNKRFDPVEAAWEFFVSLRLSVYMFILIASALVAGTFLPQGEDAVTAADSWSPSVWRLLYGLGAFDLYHTWWFATLLLMLGLNLIACSLDRLPAIWDRFRLKRPLLEPGVIAGARFSKELVPAEAVDDARLEAISREKLGAHFGSFSEKKADDGSVTLWHDSGRISRLAVLTIHASIVLILLGGIATSLLGFEGMMFISEGGEANSYSLRLQGGGTVEAALPFTVKCDKFVFEQFSDGRPKEYRSTLTIEEKGRKILTRDVSVNSPLRYGGLGFYQASYQRDPARSGFVFEFDGLEGGVKATGEGRVGGDIGSGSKLDARYSVVDYTQDLSGFGPAVRVSRKAEGEDASEFWLFRKYPNFDRKHRAARVSLSLKEERPAYLTGLQVTHDPGSIPVFAGAVLLMIGLVAVFYMSHRQVWIRIGGGRIQLAASASRNAGAMDRRVGSLKDELEREIGCT